MKLLLATLAVLTLSGCAVGNWMAAHPAQVAAIAGGAAIAQSATGTALNVRHLVEEKK